MSGVSAAREDLLLPDTLHRFRQRLAQVGSRRIALQDLWSIYRWVYGDHAAGLDARAELGAVLAALVEGGHCRLPVRSGRCWDRASTVALPSWIELVSPAVSRDREWRDFPWRPELSWVGGLSVLPADHFQFLRSVQRGLVEGWFADRAPLKYRSLQLTNDEKRLEALLGSQLFSSSRLTLDLLNCDGPWLPLAHERVSRLPRLIVFENAGSFLVARRILRALENPPFGLVAYGGGFQVLKAMPDLSNLGQLELIAYVGDLDCKGLAIGAQFARQVKASAGVKVVPATELHRAMLDAAAALGYASGWPCKTDRRAPMEDDWVAPEVRDRVAAILNRGCRIPEEVLHDGHLLALWAATK